MTVSTPSPTASYVEDDRARGLFRVARRAFTEPAVLAAERERIFAECWLYLAHESEVPAPGDFLARKVGGRELLLARGRDGAVRCFYNSCPHRGAMVCRERQGNGAMFRCFYHSWAFDLEGRLVNRPGDEAYANDTRAAGLHDLVPVASLDQYRGLWFVRFRPGGESLHDYLGGAREYLDLVLDQGEAGMEVVGGTQSYGFAANWKLLCENSFDGYHGLPTHVSYFDYLKSKPGSLVEVAIKGEAFDLGRGHAVVQYTAPWGRPVAQSVPAWGEGAAAEVAATRERLVARFGAARAERMATTNRNLLIFPNLVVNDIMAITIRTFYPETPDRQMVHAWALAPREESAPMRELRLYNFLEFLGPGGFATPDDCEALALCQRGYDNVDGAGWNDISKGYLSDTPQVDDEAQMRAFWREWDRRLNGVPA
jgi:p-cumate 2,3-dioxygenase alpha subunit